MNNRAPSLRLVATRVGVYPAAYVLAILLSVVLWAKNPPWIGSSYGRGSQFLELFGFFGTALILIIALIEWKAAAAPGRPGRSIPLLGFLIVALFYLNFLVEFNSRPYYDYQCYEQAARALLEGESPYGIIQDEMVYIYRYPPLFAQGLAGLGILARWTSDILRLHVAQESLWRGVFYVYGCLQCGLVWLLFPLCYRMLRVLTVPSSVATAATVALLIINVPLGRTLVHGQVNLWVVVPLMAAALTARRMPYVGGFLAALGVHVKLYPLVLVPQWVFLKRLRAAVGILLGAGIIAALQSVGSRQALWTLFVDFARNWPAETAVRNNSIHCIAYNSVWVVARFLGVERQFYIDSAIRIVTWVAIAVVGIYMGWRFFQRERWFRTAQSGGRAAEDIRWFGHFADACAAMLLVSPSIWEHHFVLAIPVVLFVVATEGIGRPWMVALGAGLIFAIPTFDVYPFSYHRLAGLLLLLFLSGRGVGGHGESGRRWCESSGDRF